MATFASFRDFYPYYLGEHADVRCRRLHFAGSWVALTAVVLLVTTGQLRWLWVALVGGYGFAWVGHFFFEKNRPATFRHPLYSLMGDWAMFRDILRGRVSLR
jgi:hypothetical protein